MKKTLFQQQEKELDPLITLRTSHGLCPVTGPHAEVGPIHIATPGAGPEATPTLPGWLQQAMFSCLHMSNLSGQVNFVCVLIFNTGATVEVEAGVDTVEGILVLEVAPTEVIVGKIFISASV